MIYDDFILLESFFTRTYFILQTLINILTVRIIFYNLSLLLHNVAAMITIKIPFLTNRTEKYSKTTQYY